MEDVQEHADNMKTNQHIDRSKAGFTLIEVIAVLVILGVLAAVAIPRYVNLIDDAREKALDGALAAGLSHVSLAYGQYALQNGSEPSAQQLADAANDNKPNSDDYDFTFAAGAGGVTVTASEKDDASMTGSKTWAMP